MRSLCRTLTKRAGGGKKAGGGGGSVPPNKFNKFAQPAVASPQKPKNSMIQAEKVNLIDETGMNLGLRPLQEALFLSRERRSDLVQVNLVDGVPFCRMFPWQAKQSLFPPEKKKQKALSSSDLLERAKLKQEKEIVPEGEVVQEEFVPVESLGDLVYRPLKGDVSMKALKFKELRLSVRMTDHDFSIKMKKAVEWIGEMKGVDFLIERNLRKTPVAGELSFEQMTLKIHNTFQGQAALVKPPQISASRCRLTFINEQLFSNKKN